MLRSLYAVSQSRVTRCAVVLLFGTPSWSAWHAVVKSRVSHASTLSLTHSRLYDHATDMLGVVTEFFLPVLLFLAFPFSSFPLLLFLFFFFFFVWFFFLLFPTENGFKQLREQVTQLSSTLCLGYVVIRGSRIDGNQ